MTRKFKVDDHVSWNSEAGRVRGRIIKVHRQDVDYKGYTHHASPDEPQYEIKATRPTTSRCTKAPRFASSSGNSRAGANPRATEPVLPAEEDRAKTRVRPR